MGGTELQVSSLPADGLFPSADVTFPVFVALQRLSSTPQLCWRHLCSRIPLPLAPREEEEVFQLCSFHFPPGSKGKGCWQRPSPCWEGTFPLLAGWEGGFDVPMSPPVPPWPCLRHPACPTSCVDPKPSRLNQSEVKIPLLIFVFPALDIPLRFSVYNKPLPCPAGSPSVCKHRNHGEKAARKQIQGTWTGLLQLLAGYLRKREIPAG